MKKGCIFRQFWQSCKQYQQVIHNSGGIKQGVYAQLSTRKGYRMWIKSSDFALLMWTTETAGMGLVYTTWSLNIRESGIFSHMKIRLWSNEILPCHTKIYVKDSCSIFCESVYGSGTRIRTQNIIRVRVVGATVAQFRYSFVRSLALDAGSLVSPKVPSAL